MPCDPFRAARKPWTNPAAVGAQAVGNGKPLPIDLVEFKKNVVTAGIGWQ